MQHFNCFGALLLFTPLSVLAGALRGLHPSIELGGYWSSEGIAQTVNIKYTKGDYFTLTEGNGRNGLLGAAVYLDRFRPDPFGLNYGFNFFYLPKTSVSGLVIQEKRFANLSYHYTITHYPLYVMTQYQLIPELLPYTIDLDAGIGPNFITTGNFTEKALKANSVPDQIFTGKSSMTFSATAGIALEFVPLENLNFSIGYRFFYLGKGSLAEETIQTIHTLSTGSNYANAIIMAMNF